MKLNGGQLYSAIDFLSGIYDDKVPYSSFVYLHFDKGVVTVKSCSALFVGASVQYKEPFEESYQPVVVEIMRLKNFLKNNKKIVNIEINEGFLLLKGRGNLRLNLINEMDYMICLFDDADIYSIEDENVHLEGEEIAEILLNSIQLNLRWLDTSTISQQYRDICWNGYMSTRRYKHNVSCLNTGIKEHANVQYGSSLISANFMKILNNISSIKDLKLKFNENYCTFEAIATDLDTKYFLKCRAIDGNHPIKEIDEKATELMNLNIGFAINKKKLEALVSSGLGYSEKDDVAHVVVENNKVSLTSTSESYDYSIEEEVTLFGSDRLEFNINLNSLNDILNAVVEEEIIINTDKMQNGEVSKLLIVDKIKHMSYLFPTWN